MKILIILKRYEIKLKYTINEFIEQQWSFIEIFFHVRMTLYF